MYKGQYFVVFTYKGDKDFRVMKGKNSSVIIADEENKHLLEQIVRAMQSDGLYDFAMIAEVKDELVPTEDDIFEKPFYFNK